MSLNESLSSPCSPRRLRIQNFVILTQFTSKCLVFSPQKNKLKLETDPTLLRPDGCLFFRHLFNIIMFFYYMSKDAGQSSHCRSRTLLKIPFSSIFLSLLSLLYLLHSHEWNETSGLMNKEIIALNYKLA